MARQKIPDYEYVPKLKLYRERIYDETGKRIALYGKTPKELHYKVKEAERQIEEARFRMEYPTLNDYADTWMDMHFPYVKEGTRRDYRYIIETYIKKPLGHRYLNEITQDDIKLALRIASEKSESVHRKTVMLYKRIFDSAEDSGKVDYTPCKKLNTGGKPTAKKKALTDEQVTILLDAVKTARTDIYPFVMIGLYAGMRREEIMGLKWSNVVLDSEAPHISVQTALRWEKNRPIVSDELKSTAARRDIPIPPQLVQCLQAHKAKSESDYVFSGNDGHPKTETQFSHMWRSVTTRMVKPHTYVKYLDNGEKVKRTITPKKGEKAKCRNYCYTIDFDVSPHILRHTYITNLLLAGVDVKTVQYLAGHEHAKITLDIYTHLKYNRPEDIIEKINEAFRSGVG